MRIKRLGIAVLFCLASGLAGCSRCCGSGPPNPDVVGESVHKVACFAKHGMPSITMLGNVDCKPEGCGVNGVWLGRELAFRELHISPLRENAQHLTVQSFHKDGTAMKLDVQGQELIGLVGQQKRTRGDLVGAQLELSRTKTVTRVNQQGKQVVEVIGHDSYTVTITAVADDKSFFAKCTDVGACPSADPKAPIIYSFDAVSNSDGCEVQLCQPGLDPDASSITGRAVIFRGDLYGNEADPETDQHVVRNSPTDPKDVESDTFNFACIGTALSKQHLLRHTVASQALVSLEARQAMLRALTGDYCGNGSAFTVDGLALGIGFKSSTYKPIPESDLTNAATIDAMWDKDGARCLGVPRLARVPAAGTAKDIGDHIKASCTSKVFTDCTQPPPTMATLDGPTAPAPASHVLTGNP